MCVQGGTPRPRTLAWCALPADAAATLCPQAWKAHFLRDAPSPLLAGRARGEGGLTLCKDFPAPRGCGGNRS